MITHFSDDNFAESFENLSLAHAEIFKIEFEGCTFRECDFSHAILKSCIFSDCHFTQCNFTLTDVLDTRFCAVTFESSKLIGIDWSRADWSSLTKQPLKFQHATLNSSSFWGLDMHKWQITECDASEVDFREANLSEANLSCTNLNQALFRNTNLSSANLSHCQNLNIDIYANKLKQAKISRYEALKLLSSLDIVLVD